MPQFERSEVTVHYEMDGDGPAILLLPGMLSDSATWAPLVPLLPNHTLVRIDNRTTGRTIPWDAPVDMPRMVDDALSLMDHLGHRTFHIVGHSMGGLMGLECAGTAPNRIKTVSVLASGRNRMPRISGMFDALIAVREGSDGKRLWLRSLYPLIFGSAFFEDPAMAEAAVEAALAYPHAQSLQAMKRQVAMFQQMELKADLKSLNMPVHVLYGAEDILVPPEMARPGFAPVPNLTEHWVEGAGHSVVWDAPEVVAGHITAFLAAYENTLS